MTPGPFGLTTPIMKKPSMKITHVFDKSTLLVFEQDGYRISTLPPFRKFRGLDIPWHSVEDLHEESELVEKFSDSRKVVHLAAGQYGLPVEVHVKRYQHTSILKRALACVRKSRSREAFELGWRLLDKKIKTPRPVWLAEVKGAFSCHSILAHESIPEGESAFERWMRCATDRQRLELLTAVGQFVAVLHDAGFCHDDCKSSHLLILPHRPSSADELHVIDLYGGYFSRALSPLARARNLHKLVRSFSSKRLNTGFTVEHRRVILKAYGGSERDADYWETWVSQIGRMKGQKV